MTQTTLKDVAEYISKLSEDTSFQQSIKQGFYLVKIAEVKPTTSHKFFVVKTYKDKEGIEVMMEGGDTFFIPIPDRLIGSQMGSFIQKYGEMPKVGMTIEIDTTEHYPRIKLD